MTDFNITNLPLNDAALIEFKLHKDERGTFERLFCNRSLDQLLDSTNIVNINSNDPNKKYIPDPNKKIEYQDFKDGFFHEESTLLNNPPSELRGIAKNRFYNLFHDPQKTAIEPFNRVGDNTYLNLIDNYEDC